jgi:amino acid permease
MRIDSKDDNYLEAVLEKVIAEEDANATGTLFSSTANLANTILGSGILVMPFVFANLGIAQGVVLLTLSAFLSVFGLNLLTKMANTLNSRDVSFNAICMTAYPAAAVLMDFAIALLCYGAGVSYLIIGMSPFYLISP